jgi:L-lactate dehydrogenase
MKISIIGSGMVGGAIANALVQTQLSAEILLIDKVRSIAEAQALDVNSGGLESTLVRAGELEDVRDSTIVVLSAGKRSLNGLTAKQLLQMNLESLESTLKRVLELAPNAIIINAMQPIDLMTNAIAKILGAKHAARVIGTGTMLETNLFRQTLAAQLGVHPKNVHGYVLGEQGGSALIAWSGVQIAGVAFEMFLEQHNTKISHQEKARIGSTVQHAVQHALQQKGTFLFGLGTAIANLIGVIQHNQLQVLTVSAWDETRGVALSLPRVIGDKGIVETLEPTLSPDEASSLEVIIGYFRNA